MKTKELRKRVDCPYLLRSIKNIERRRLKQVSLDIVSTIILFTITIGLLRIGVMIVEFLLN